MPSRIMKEAQMRLPPSHEPTLKINEKAPILSKEQ